MAKYKSHKAALLGTIRELEKRGYAASDNSKAVEEMTPDECEEFILDAIDDTIYNKDCQIVHLKANIEKYESLKDAKEPEKHKFVSPSQTHKTFWERLKYILFE